MNCLRDLVVHKNRNHKLQHPGKKHVLGGTDQEEGGNANTEELPCPALQREQEVGMRTCFMALQALRRFPS